MRRLSLTLAAVAAVFLVLAVQADQHVTVEKAPLTWTQAALGDGEDLYAQVCATCHGMDAKGGGPAAEVLVMPVPDLTRLAIDNGGVYPAERVQKSITGEGEIKAHGPVEMPIWGKAFEDARPDLKPGQRWAFARMRIAALTAYIETLQAEK